MQTIAITSGKGGVGKTSLSVNLAAALAQKKHRVVLFDGDLGLANIDIVAGISPEFTLQQVVTGHLRLSDVLTDTSYGVKVISGGSAVSLLMQAGPKRLSMFFEQLEELSATTDFLIIDTSAGLDTRVQTFLAKADHIVVVATSEPTSITDAYALIKVHTRKHPNADIHILSNSTRNSEEGIAIYATLRQVCDVFINQTISFLGEVRYDPVFHQAILSRVPFCIGAPKSHAALDLTHIAEKIEGFSRSCQAVELFPKMAS